MVKKTKPTQVQVYDPKTKRWVRVSTVTCKIVARKRTAGAYAGIPKRKTMPRRRQAAAKPPAAVTTPPSYPKVADPPLKIRRKSIKMLPSSKAVTTRQQIPRAAPKPPSHRRAVTKLMAAMPRIRYAIPAVKATSVFRVLPSVVSAVSFIL